MYVASYVAAAVNFGVAVAALAAWAPKCPASAEGWIFPRVGHHGGSVLKLQHFYRSVIRPILKEKKVAWKGLYAGRRGGATALVELTGNLVAAQELLRHKSMMTTAQFYKKRTQTALASGMKLLEAASDMNQRQANTRDRDAG